MYYDVEYSHRTDEPGAPCTPGRPATGGNVIYDSPDDALPAVDDFIDPANGTFPSFDENGSIYPHGVDKNPAAIMRLRNDASSLNSATFPVDPATCKTIPPWDYLGDNTIFQVIHNAGLRTAWSDKHAVYLSFNGPGSQGKSIDDFFGPEIDSQAVEPNGVPYPQDDDWAHIDAATKQYDGYKVRAVLNEIAGRDHSGRTKVGTPAIFGMNFQTVSVAQKIPSTPTTLIGPDAHGNYTTSAPQPGATGGSTAGWFPARSLSSALDYVDAQLGRMMSRTAQGRPGPSTTIIVTAKHGQSPRDPQQARHGAGRPDRRRDQRRLGQDPPGQHEPHRGRHRRRPVAVLPVGQLAGRVRFRQALPVEPQRTGLRHQRPPGHRPALRPHADLGRRGGGEVLRRRRPRRPYPDVFGKVQVGVVYAKPTKLAEHGGMNRADRHVLMVVDGPGIPARVRTAGVETTQVAPTVLTCSGSTPLC